MVVRRWKRKFPQNDSENERIDLTDRPEEKASAKVAERIACGSPGEVELAPERAQGSAVRISPHVSTAFERRATAGQRHFVTAPAQHGSVEEVGKAGSSTCSTSDVSSSPHESIGRRALSGTLVWIRHFDLRLHDHPGLAHAAAQPGPVHLLFVWSPEEDRQSNWPISGSAAGVWLHSALAAHAEQLAKRYGLSVVFRSGATMETVLKAAEEARVTEVVTSTAYEPAASKSEREVETALKAAGLRFRRFQSFLLCDIERGEPAHPLEEPTHLAKPDRPLQGCSLADLGLAKLPVRQDGSVVRWDAPIYATWDISEKGALGVWKRFIGPGGGFSRYEESRNLASASALARISPYLRFGMLSPRKMYWEMKAAGGRHVSVTFWRRLVWRDLAYWQLLHFPTMQDKPIRSHYDGQEWNWDDRMLQRWQKGQTGYPLIDAGMRELWATGWMAQNVRMAAAVLLCEIMNISWVEGEKWFHHTLVDADLAINAMMWQNAGKSGLDQWNFTVHPARAGRGQDPDGCYTRRWCPELAALPNRYLHSPWEAPQRVLSEAGVKLGAGGNYPDRVVQDVQAAVKNSFRVIRRQRAEHLDWNDNHGYDLIRLPRGSTVSHDGQKWKVFTRKEYRITDDAQAEEPDDIPQRHDVRYPAHQVASRQHYAQTQGKGRGKGGGRGPRNRNETQTRHQNDNQEVLQEYMGRAS
nr:CPD photolyase [Crypthecodinium cohnii]